MWVVYTFEKSTKILAKGETESNPDGWDIRFEIVKDYKIDGQAYSLLVDVKPQQGEDLQISQHRLEISLLHAAEYLVNEKSKPAPVPVWLVRIDAETSKRAS